MALRDLFDRTAAAAPAARPAAPQPQAPGTRIAYDPLLLDQLRRDHRKLLDLFAVTQALLSSHDYDGVQRKLGEFRVMLQDHLLTANTKLYIYVSRQLADDPVYSALVNTVRRMHVLHHNPDFMHTRNFNLTFPLQAMGDLAFFLGKPTWWEVPSTKVGIRGTWRSLDRNSPRYCPAKVPDATGALTCDPTAPGPDGSEWEIRTYLTVGW